MNSMKKSAIAVMLAIGAMASSSAQASVIWSGNGHEYDVISAAGVTWTAARSAALGLGGDWDLATITSGAEDSFVTSLLPTSPSDRSHYWLGATDAASEGSFAWVSGEAFSYTNWWSGEPNDFINEDFLAYDYRGTSWAWNDGQDDMNVNYPGFARGYVIERTLSVPEPASLALMGIGLVGLGAMRRRRQPD